jgi:ankyrin repeat protein
MTLQQLELQLAPPQTTSAAACTWNDQRIQKLYADESVKQLQDYQNQLSTTTSSARALNDDNTRTEGLNSQTHGAGYTSLHSAAQYKQFEIVSLLVESGQEVNPSHPSTGITPLLVAARQGDFVTVQLLRGARDTHLHAVLPISISQAGWFASPAPCERI